MALPQRSHGLPVLPANPPAEGALSHPTRHYIGDIQLDCHFPHPHRWSVRDSPIIGVPTTAA